MPQQKKNALQRQRERREEQEEAKKQRREAELARQKAHNERIDFGTYEPRYNTSKRLNQYDIHALNRQGNTIARAKAVGSQKMHEARQRIWTSKHTWLKFSTYNQTRGKFLK